MTYFRASSNIDVPTKSFVAFILERTQKYRNDVALIDGPTGQHFSYQDVERQMRTVAGNLVSRGMKAGEVTAIISPNNVWYPSAIYGIAFAGGTFTTLNPLSTPEDVVKLLDMTDATRVMVSQAVYERLKETLSGLSLKEVIVFGEAAGCTSYASMLVGKPLAKERSLDLEKDTLALLFSSGTSGFPKAVMLSNRNFVAAVSQMNAGEVFKEGETLLAALPFFHVYGQVCFLGYALSKGSRLVVLPGFDFEMVLKLVQEHKITTLPLVAPIVQLLAKHPLVEHFDLTSLRLIISGASPISAELMRMAAARLKVPVVNGWGLTESTTNGAFSDLTMRDGAVGSVGKVMHGMEVRTVLTGTNQDAPDGEEGEVLIRGPNVMLGYHKNPTATKETLDAEGWLRTGDVGRFDEDGNISITDRAKDFIKFKGFQISPAELEGILITHPAVADAGVIPSPDAEAGEVPKAFVVKRGHVTDSELFDFVAARVSPFKRLRDIEFVGVIPKTPAGKILRRVLIAKEREKRSAASMFEGRIEDRVVVERHGAVLSICLDRPRKMNAFDMDMINALGRALAILEDDPTLRVGVLHANGHVFTSGLDIISAAPLAARGDLKLDAGLVDMFEIDSGARRRTKPVVAAIRGKCLNLGVELAGAADFVIASEDAVFAQREVAVGLFPFGGTTVFLPPKIGAGNAMRYILTAEDFSAETARQMGLVQEVTAGEQLLPKAMELAQRIAHNSPIGIAAALASVRIAREQGPLAALRLLAGEIARLTATEDFKEGVAAFQEKRVPNFVGR